jgi:hypothetical protein
MTDIVQRIDSVGNGDTWSSYEVLGLLAEAGAEIARLRTACRQSQTAAEYWAGKWVEMTQRR